MKIYERGRPIWSMIFLLAAAIVVTRTLRNTTLPDGPRLALVLVPIPFAIWAIWDYVKRIRKADEFQRRVMLESLAIAFPFSLVLGLTVEYLQKGGFAMGIDVGGLWPLQGIVWAVALVYSYWRYS